VVFVKTGTRAWTGIVPFEDLWKKRLQKEEGDSQSKREGSVKRDLILLTLRKTGQIFGIFRTNTSKRVQNRVKKDKLKI